MNPELIYKTILWEIAGLRAEIASLRGKMDLVSEAMGKPPLESLEKENEKREDQMQLELFRESCAYAGLSGEPPTGPDKISQN